MTDDIAEARSWFEKHFHRKGEYDVSRDEVHSRPVIDVNGDCRVNPQHPPTEIKYKFRTITGNFCLRGATPACLTNMPQHVGGIAALSWTSNFPMLTLIRVNYEVFLSADQPADLTGRLAIIDKYRHQNNFKKMMLDAQRELIDQGYHRNARL